MKKRIKLMSLLTALSILTGMVSAVQAAENGTEFVQYDYIDLSSYINDESIGTDGIGRVGDQVDSRWLDGKSTSNNFAGVDANDLPEDGTLYMNEYYADTDNKKSVNLNIQTPFKLYTDGYAGGVNDSFKVKTSQTINLTGKRVKYVNVLVGASSWENINVVLNYIGGAAQTVASWVDNYPSVPYQIGNGMSRYNKATYGLCDFADKRWLEKDSGNVLVQRPTGKSGLLEIKIPVSKVKNLESVTLKSNNALIYGITLENMTSDEIAAVKDNYFEYDSTSFKNIDLSDYKTYSIDDSGNLVMTLQKTVGAGEKLVLGGEGVEGNVRFRMVYRLDDFVAAPYYLTNGIINVGELFGVWALGANSRNGALSDLGQKYRKDMSLFEPNKYNTLITEIDTETGVYEYGLYQCDTLEEAQAAQTLSHSANLISSGTSSCAYSASAMENVVLGTNPSATASAERNITVYYAGLNKIKTKSYNYVDLSSYMTIDAIGKVGETVNGTWINDAVLSEKAVMFGGLDADKLPENGMISTDQYFNGALTDVTVPFKLHTAGYSANVNDAVNGIIKTPIKLTGGYDNSVSVLFASSGWNTMNINIAYTDGMTETSQVNIERPYSMHYNKAGNRYKDDLFGYKLIDNSKWLKNDNGSLSEIAESNGPITLASITIPTNPKKEIDTVSISSNPIWGDVTMNLFVYAVTEEISEDGAPKVTFEPEITVADNTASVNVKMLNTTDYAQSYCIVLAAYDEQGSLIAVNSTETENLEANSSKSQTVTLNDISSKAVKYKAMVWENLNNIRPLEYAEK